jgi:hypothetical protein
VYELQATKLFGDKKQEEANRQGGIQEVLSLVQQAHATQGNKVVS